MYSVLCLHQSPWGLTSQHFDTSLCLFRLFRWPGMFSTHFQSHSENVTTFHSLTLMVPLLAGQSRFLLILNWPPPLLCSLYTWFMLSLQSLWIIVTTLCLCPPSYLKHVKFFVLSTLSGVVVLPNSFSVLILMVSNICVNAAMKLDKEMATHSSVLAWRIPMDRGAWWATVHGVAKSWTGLSNFIFTLRQHIKEQRHYFANKGPSSQSYGFSSSHVWMWELDCEESWAPKN